MRKVTTKRASCASCADRDGYPDVATLLGYASRKLGRYDDAKVWYEQARAADPDHAVTWSYYGMWQAEQGNVLKAKDDLEKVRRICGTDCRAYRSSRTPSTAGDVRRQRRDFSRKKSR